MENENQNNSKPEIRLKIDAHVVRQLGEELISDPEQAILELVKNSYDADSAWCAVEIDTGFKETNDDDIEINEENPRLVGKISIRDSGAGMDLSQLLDGWLTISHSAKRNLKSNKTLTKDFERAYQGDKGLGRLSTMKLGRKLTIHTGIGDGVGRTISINWDDFYAGKTLDQIDVSSDEFEKRNKGTKIEVTGLYDVSHWSGESAGKRLQSRLSTLISPFKFDDNFKVTLTINRVHYPLSGMLSKIEIPSVAVFDYSYDCEFLWCRGRVRLPYYIPGEERSAEKIKGEYKYSRYALPDGGVELYKHFLSYGKDLSSYEISLSENVDWYVEFEKKFSWKELDKKSVSSFSNPGKFKSKWYYVYKKGVAFDRLTNGKLDRQDMEAISSMTGVGVYKDSFKVGTDSKKDWLEFSADKTSGKGFYSLRPENTIGYIRFEGYEGHSLVEKSDRQGFVENPVYNGFWVITRSMVKFANDFLNASRRAANEFYDLEKLKEKNKVPNYSAEAAAVEINDIVERVSATEAKSQKHESQVESQISVAKQRIGTVLDDLLLDERSRERIVELKNLLDAIQGEFLLYKDSYSSLRSRILDIETSIDKILGELGNYKDRVSDLYDSASVGLAAENLAHDINSQIDDVGLNISGAKGRIERLGIKDVKLSSSLNQMAATIRVISKDISLLNPMLRSRRQKIVEFSVEEAVREYVELRADKHLKQNIHVNILALNKQRIRFSRGKFTQVLDNLFRNSEYWLDHFSKHQNIEKKIEIELIDDGIIFSDSGLGISNNMESMLFEMFTTSKAEGQGLGLFIVKNILESFNCDVQLLPDLNIFGSRYKFYIDLSGAILDD